MHTHVSASIQTENYKTIIKSEFNELISDEAVSVGGGGTGFNPHELLAVSHFEWMRNANNGLLKKLMFRFPYQKIKF